MSQGNQAFPGMPNLIEEMPVVSSSPYDSYIDFSQPT